MSAPGAPLGFGLYFIDVLACLLFGITLSLATARFDAVQRIAVDLPVVRSERPDAGAPELSTADIALREEQGALRIYLEEQPVTLAELEDRLRAAPPPGVVVRSEESVLARVIALAHAAGVEHVELAYELGPQQGGAP